MRLYWLPPLPLRRLLRGGLGSFLCYIRAHFFRSMQKGAPFLIHFSMTDPTCIIDTNRNWTIMAKKRKIQREKKRQKLEQKSHLIRRPSKNEKSKVASLSEKWEYFWLLFILFFLILLLCLSPLQWGRVESIASLQAWLEVRLRSWLVQLIEHLRSPNLNSREFGP